MITAIDRAMRRPIVAVTYNSAELDEFVHWRHMFRGLVAAGAMPLAIDCLAPPPDIGVLLARLDALVISGGGDIDPSRYGADPTDPTLRGVHPPRDLAEFAALDFAMARELPILAICRGAQVVNVACGGTLYVDIARDCDRAIRHRDITEETLDRPLHTVNVRHGSTLASWLGAHGQIAVNSQHHQGIRDLAETLIPVADSPDGLIEAFEHRDKPVYAVQWHPEVLWPHEAHAMSLLTHFVDRCRPR